MLPVPAHPPHLHGRHRQHPRNTRPKPVPLPPESQAGLPKQEGLPAIHKNQLPIHPDLRVQPKDMSCVLYNGICAQEAANILHWLLPLLSHVCAGPVAVSEYVWAQDYIVYLRVLILEWHHHRNIHLWQLAQKEGHPRNSHRSAVDHGHRSVQLRE